jgi:acetyltransferase
MREAGVHRVQSLKEMADCFKAFSLPTPRGPNLAIISRSGGHAVLAADSAYRHGFHVASFSDDFFGMLSEKTRAGVIRRTNPIDLGDVFDLNVYLEITEDALREKGVDGVLVVHSYALHIELESTKRFLSLSGELSKRYGKPVVFCLMPHREDWPGLLSAAEAAHFPIFTHVDEALAALRQSFEYFRHQGIVSTKGPQERKYKEDRATIPRLPTGAMSIDRVFHLLGQYGLAVADFRIVEGMNEGLDAAREIGYPLALKTASSHVLHKTEHGAVLLDIENEAMFVKAFQRIEIGPYLIQRMVPSGCEIIIGGRNDPEFGPIILCGLGGIFVEVYNDVAVRVAPIDEEMARQMIEELRGAIILKGFRGQQPYDAGYLVTTLVNVSRLLVEHPEINVLDINPLILMGKGNGGIVVDVKLQVV